VVPALTVIPLLEASSPELLVIPLGRFNAYEVVTLLDCEFWTSMLRLKSWVTFACAVEGVAVTVMDVGSMNSTVASEDDLEPPDHVAVTWYV
jgi:hypothetical protein